MVPVQGQEHAPCLVAACAFTGWYPCAGAGIDKAPGKTLGKEKGEGKEGCEHQLICCCLAQASSLSQEAAASRPPASSFPSLAPIPPAPMHRPHPSPPSPQASPPPFSHLQLSSPRHAGPIVHPPACAHHALHAGAPRKGGHRQTICACTSAAGPQAAAATAAAATRWQRPRDPRHGRAAGLGVCSTGKRKGVCGQANGME